MKRGPLVNISITLSADLVAQIDQRVRDQDTDRSKYLRGLARRDLAKEPSKRKAA
jgi:metal-responsive CopG/Arc/MetJ family transcriptional regulator